MCLENCEYDFIIIGGGSAGGVVANRLSENPKWKILLLEDGDTGDGLMNIPTLAFAFQGTRFDWQYRTEKQPDMSLGIEENQMPYPRGRVLGGSSGINYMMYVRGSKDDFNKWGEKNPG
ncbi:hypothetical protein NQ314_011803 [Rhamnusium bicolor]|uniref:Glucose-methanol-choline oxidoreductase N-terminal domain-containing protein n=1 Tax=Rhamnusium bicolor TaxID=1586634 RepID=A0AAV8XG25_9CUCU|nr:hypothetical protein NQ314_011803 [Rhamnusium bicolor]